MAIDVTVYYGSGDKAAPDTVNPLSASIAAAQGLGKQILVDSYGLTPVSLSCAANLSIVPGMIVQVADSRQGDVWYGQVIDVAHDVSTGSDAPVFDTTLQVLKA